VGTSLCYSKDLGDKKRSFFFFFFSMKKTFFFTVSRSLTHPHVDFSFFFLQPLA